ncbi:MAG TPA: alkaline phosphatase family protein, partial [Xanthomonadales bacterium]|nr:alkaline phosphatase family protein [Xanthomonadales bacterium]
MLENRSYDNVLGLLYNANNAPPYNEAPQGQSTLWGLTGTESNLNPNPPPASFTVTPAVGDPPVVATTIPTIDPGEPFADMAQQILGLTSVDETTNPYASPVGPYGLMGGFVANYATQNRWGTDSVPEQVMMCMTPALMPVTAFLANNYMICDGWFGSAPTQTFANRLFSVCASSGTWVADPQENLAYSYIDDKEYAGLDEDGAFPVFDAANRLALPTVFAQLDNVLGKTQNNKDGEPFPSWKLYFHDYSITAGLLDYVYDQYTNATSLNVGQYDTTDYTSQSTHLANKNFTTFAQDLAAGTLASFTLIEPRYS